jgi:hypothetical protein
LRKNSYSINLTYLPNTNFKEWMAGKVLPVFGPLVSVCCLAKSSSPVLLIAEITPLGDKKKL